MRPGRVLFKRRAALFPFQLARPSRRAPFASYRREKPRRRRVLLRRQRSRQRALLQGIESRLRRLRRSHSAQRVLDRRQLLDSDAR